MAMELLAVGARSDIAKGVLPLLESGGYRIHDWDRTLSQEAFASVIPKWDVFISFVGTVAPVALWHDCNLAEWEKGVESNLLIPFRLLHKVWGKHNPNATVIFMAGSNPNMIMPGYSSYNTGKMALNKLVEQLDAETPDAKFVALGPGIVLTKIHEPSMTWENPKLKVALETKQSTAMEDIAASIFWLIDEPKNVVGGRNICVSDLVSRDRQRLTDHLYEWEHMFKLRRSE
jgi:NAD(P)-dependent dehydrogenase (short-subunit alcohol dehydrogenase family)